MTQQEFNSFLEKVALSYHTEKDMQRFRQWVQSLPENEAEKVLMRYAEVLNTDQAIIEPDILSSISKGIENQLNEPKKHPYSWSFLLKVAAITVLALSVSLYIYQSNSEHSLLLSKENEIIEPGKDQAILVLADGTKIKLDEKPNGIIKKNQDITGFSKQSGLLTYQASESAAKVSQTHTLEVPKGGQYQLLLPDGTQVWLNASSSLTFPSAFDEHHREVTLTGEAYFEVAKNTKAPFIVKTTKSIITVLGTHFNIRAYIPETDVTTTLLEGAVTVANRHHETLLKPGNQAICSTGDEIRVQEVETSYAVAWKNGYFMFNQQPLQEVLEQIARWYDIEIIYQGDKPKNKIWGTISRRESFNDVLATLQDLGSVHFKVEGRRVYVKRTTS